MKYLLYVLLFLCFNNVYAQSCIWAKDAGSTREDFGVSSTHDVDGNVYVAGNFASTSITFGTTTLTNAYSSGSFSDIFLVKYKNNGNVLWAISFGGLDNDYPTSVNADNYGNIYISGYFLSDTLMFGSVKLARQGGANMFFAKYDTAGNFIWAKNKGGSSTSTVKPASMSNDVDGNILITGLFNSPVLIFGSYTLNNASVSGLSTDMFLVKYDSSGNVIWAQNSGGIGTEGGAYIKADATGSIYVTGFFSSPSLSFGTNMLSLTGVGSIFIVKYNALGVALWVKSAGGTNGDESKSLALDSLANVYITGTSQSPVMYFGSLSVTNAYPSTKFFFLAKYDSSGNAIWAKGANGLDENVGISVNADMPGNIFVTGYFTSPTLKFDTITLTNALAYTRDFFIVNYDTSGNVIWATKAGGSANDGATSVTTIDSSVYITGYFASPTIKFGSTTLTNQGNADFFLTKYNESAHTNPVIVYLPKKVHRSISIFPNPAIEELCLQSAGITDIHTIEVYDVVGILKFECSAKNYKVRNNNTITIRFPILPDGNYILKVVGNDISERIPFVIRH